MNDRMGERHEIIYGDNDRNIMKLIASEPVRPGTVTRIDIHHPSSSSGSKSNPSIDLEGILGEEAW